MPPPLNLNPALAGNMSGKYRMSLIYRSQWQAAIDKPFKTVSASFDMNFHVGLERKDKVGIGFVFFSDRAGINNFVTNRVAVSSAFHKSLSLYENQFLSGGIQIGLAQQSVNYENITFNDQFDGDGGYTFATGEMLPRNNIGYLDLSAGIYWTLVPNSRSSVHIGLGTHHINLPDVGFEDEPIERLPPNFTVHLGGQFPFGNSRVVDILPRALFYIQGGSFEANAGANLKVIINQFNGNSIYFGTWARPVLDVDSPLALDAVVVLFAVEIDKVRFGFSADANVSTLNASTNGFGAFELSVAYTGRDDSKIVLCPTF